MSQLFRRLDRLTRSELNHSNGKYATGDLTGAAFVAGGAAAGASIGTIGILAGGAGYSIGAVPLGAAGALTGAALYVVIKAIVEGDASSLGAAATGAIAGAGVSAAIGGVGVSVGGTAFGVGMASMAGVGAIAGLGIVGLNRLFQQGIDPEKLLELAIEDMERDLLKFRQALIPVIAAQKRAQQQYEQAQAEVKQYQDCVALALQHGKEDLARAALLKKKSYIQKVDTLKAQIEQQATPVNRLKRKLITFESKLAQAKANSRTLKAQIRAAKAQLQVQSSISSLNTGGSMAAFERMEDKVLMMEAHSQSAAELAGADLESQFALLESGSDVDDELAAMKAQLTDKTTLSALPASEEKKSFGSAVDDELEALRKQIDHL